MPEVVALALRGGPAWIDELNRAWDAGDAVAPVDLRLPPAARAQQLEASAPTVIVDESGRHRAAAGRPAEPGDALVVSTSGTSGEPRAVVLTHASLQAGAIATSSALQIDPDRDKWLACLPLAHVGGLGVVTRAVLTGTPLEVHDGFDSAQVAEAARRGANLVALVPTTLHRVDPTVFRRILLGGSAVPGPRPPNSVATYGMTETGGGVVYDGRPLAGVECRVADGEIQVRCPMLLRAYRDGTDPRLPDGWYPTGDAGTFDGREVLIHGRLDDVIVTGGEKVWPARVERVLGARPDVAGVAVVGRTHATWGEAVTAVVVPADPSAPPTLDALREEAKRTLPSWYAPTALELVGELPRTSLGKIRRAALRLR